MDFVGNLLLFPAVKELWKSVKNWQSYCHEYGVLFFGTQYYICKLMVKATQCWYKKCAVIYKWKVILT